MYIGFLDLSLSAKQESLLDKAHAEESSSNCSSAPYLLDSNVTPSELLTIKNISRPCQLSFRNKIAPSWKLML